MILRLLQPETFPTTRRNPRFSAPVVDPALVGHGVDLDTGSLGRLRRRALESRPEGVKPGASTDARSNSGVLT